MDEVVDKGKFEGKTIDHIDTTCVNVVHFHFTDGTKVSLWADIGGPFGIPYMYTSEYEDA